VLLAGARGRDRSGRGRVIVLIVVAVLVAGVALILARVGSRGSEASPVANDAAPRAAKSGGDSATAADHTPPVVRSLRQLEQLIDDGKPEAMAIEEPGPDASADQMRSVEQEWYTWVAQFEDRLDQIAAEMPEPPPDGAERELKLGYHRMLEAIEQLRRLVPAGSSTEVPRHVFRESVFGIAGNHLESAREYFYRIGL
jgi:hypothetical protein